MANMNIRTPKFFVDNINHRIASGTAQDGNADVMSGTSLINTFNTGSEAELFDMRPMNQVEFETSDNASDHVLINVDTGGGFRTDFIAILNHNMVDAQARVRVCHSATEGNIATVAKMEGGGVSDGTEISVSNEDKVLNSDTVTNGNEIAPDTNGSTIFTFTATTNRYIGIQFEGSGNADGTSSGNLFDSSIDLKIGCIMVGEHYTMPVAPDLNVKRTIIYDSVSVNESMGGQRYSNATNLGRNWLSSSNKSPFTLANQSYYVYNGRIAYDMNFSFLASSDIMPSDYSVEQTSSDTVVADLWSRVNGRMIPFIFTTDSTSTSESDYLFARFGQDSLEMNQVAPDVFNVSMRIEEEF